MNRRWSVLVVAALAALLLVPAAILLVVAPVAAPSARQSDVPVSPSDAPSPSELEDSAIAFVDAGSPQEAAWYRIGGNPGQFPPHLQVGTMEEGVTFERVMADPTVPPNAIVPLRPVLGVGDGVVVIVEDDRRRSTLRAVVAASGDVHDLLASDDVIVNGVLDADGRVAYYLTADRTTGDLISAWRVVVGGGTSPEPIEELIAARHEFRLAAITRLFSRMLLSPDGGTLGVFRCVELDCLLRAVRTDDGSLVGEVRLPRGGPEPFAITNTSVLLRPIVPDGPFRLGEVIDLASGAGAPMPFEGWPFGTPALIESADGPVMAAQSAGLSVPGETGQPAEPPRIAIIGAADMVVAAEYAPALTSLAVLDADDPSVGVDLPPGWILMWGTQPGDAAMSAYAMSAADGTLVPLPDVGGLFVQG